MLVLNIAICKPRSLVHPYDPTIPVHVSVTVSRVIQYNSMERRMAIPAVKYTSPDVMYVQGTSGYSE